MDLSNGSLLPSASAEMRALLMTSSHSKAQGATGASLHVLGTDASAARHGLYTSCGFLGGDPARGGNYTLSVIGVEYAKRVMGGTRTST